MRSYDAAYAESETPRFLGRGIAALAADPEVGRKNGRVLASWDLGNEYGLTDVDGRKPDWGAFMRKKYGDKYNV